jgi:hypothetical protein
MTAIPAYYVCIIGAEREMHIISYIDQVAVIKKILQHLGLWEDAHAPPDRGPQKREITFDPAYIQLT